MTDLREGSDRTEQQQSANESGVADHLLSTASRRHFSDPQITRWEHYDGPLKDMPEDRARYLLGELLSYFSVSASEGMPLPPTGLPGALNKQCSWHDPAWDVLCHGWDYFLCALLEQPRAMHNRWDAADLYVRNIEMRAREALISEMQQRHRAEREQEDGRKAAISQSVYFIAGESGPIKIGIATNPVSRLKSLQTGHHERLAILATCDGGQAREQEYHQRFAARRLNGEWFERCSEILAEIERLQ